MIAWSWRQNKTASLGGIGRPGVRWRRSLQRQRWIALGCPSSCDPALAMQAGELVVGLRGSDVTITSNAPDAGSNQLPKPVTDDRDLPRAIFQHVLAFNIAAVRKATTECGHEMRGVGERCATKKSNHRRRRLQRARRERPNDSCAAECGKQFPPSDGECTFVIAATACAVYPLLTALRVHCGISPSV